MPGFQVRRATVDDLPALLELWSSMRLPTQELERRVTEFQIAVSDEGDLLAALAMQVRTHAARLHSEAILDYAIADPLRAAFWERMQSLAVNQGIARLWTTEAAPFWKQNGFQAADTEALKRLPVAWQSETSAWLTLRLRDEDALRTAVEMSFDRLKLEERQHTNRMMSSARTFKFIALALAVVLVIAMILFCINLLRHAQMFRRY